MMEPKKCPDFVLDLQKVSAPTKKPKNCPKCVQLAEGHCSDEAAEKMSKIVFNFQGIALTMQPKKCLDFVPDLQKVSAPTKQPKKCLNFVFNFQGIALTRQPKKCPKFVQLAGHCSGDDWWLPLLS